MGLLSDRSIAVFDLETTGGDPDNDRIIQFGGVKLSGDLVEIPSRIAIMVDPDYPISPESTAIHGITNADLVGRPKFAEVAVLIEQWIGDCDLAGHNILAFDLPLLIAEFERHTDIRLKLERRPIYDTFELFKHFVPHTLDGALWFYQHEHMEDAHDALFDADAAAKVLRGIQGRHTLNGNDAWNLSTGNRATFCGALIYDENGEVCIGFGQFKGVPLSEVRARDPGFLDWMMGAKFRQEVKTIVWEMLSGPAKPEGKENM